MARPACGDRPGGGVHRWPDGWRGSPLRLARLAPTLVAAALAGAYVVVSPPSLDLAAQLFRAHLFAAEGFGLWDNWWYSGHDIVGYSVLFGAVAAQLTPQLAAALATVGTAALFERLVREGLGPDAWLGALVFGAATATDLYSGRLSFAFATLPALGAVFALGCRRYWIACALAGLAALCSPLAALFTALSAAGFAIAGCRERRSLRSALGAAAVALAGLAPVAVIALAFTEGGTEPFAFSTLWPIVVIAAMALVAVPRELVTLRAAVAVYGLATIAVYLIPSPIGSNIARLGTLLAAPLAALVWWPRRTALGLMAVPALLYLQWQGPVRDVSSTVGDPSTSAAYYRPLLAVLRREGRPPAQPFRTEIPFTRSHWEAYWVAPAFPLARGWERQLDVGDNAIFYRGGLTGAIYRHWLHVNAVRFVAVPDARLDYSATAEVRLISRGLPYLRLVMRARHWRIYAVAEATALVTGPAALRAIGPDWLALYARAPGSVVLRVRFSPYWALAQGSGCVAPAGAYIRLTLRRPGPVRLVTAFSPTRIAAASPRCQR